MTIRWNMNHQNANAPLAGVDAAPSSATMHLTNNEPIRSDALAASGCPDTAGALEQKIEVTPEMIEAAWNILHLYDSQEDAIVARNDLPRDVYVAMEMARLKPRIF